MKCDISLTESLAIVVRNFELLIHKNNISYYGIFMISCRNIFIVSSVSFLLLPLSPCLQIFFVPPDFIQRAKNIPSIASHLVLNLNV